MKKVLKLISITILALTVLSSCEANGDEAPEGLQIVKVSESDGFIFYAPENWSIINTDDVAAAKVSAVNNTSITFVSAEMPKESIPEYFEKSLSEFPESISSTMTVTLRDQECTFGNADGEAYKYIYTYKYQDYDFACMQILLTHGEGFYIFTYTSYGDVTDESSTYRQYLDSVQLAIENFKFTESKEASGGKTYEKDADGYNLVSDETLSGFSLYLPQDYEVVYSSGFVKAKISDGANISLSKATQTGIGIIDYLELRKSELINFTTDLTDLRITLTTEVAEDSALFNDWSFDVRPDCDPDLCFGDLDKNGIIAYEYTYVFNGKQYHVYQILGVDSMNGYVLTYTALEDEYYEHIEEIKTVLEKVRF